MVTCDLGATALAEAFFGQGSANILLNDVECSGNEQSLLECPSTKTPDNCDHSEDAGVRCHNCECM